MSSQEGQQQSGTIRPLNFNSLGLTSKEGILASSYGSLTVEIVANNANDTATSTRLFLGGGEDNNWSNRVSPEKVYARLRRPAVIPQEEQKKVAAAASLTIPTDDARTIYSILWDEDFLFTFSVQENTNNNITCVVSVGRENGEATETLPAMWFSFYRHPCMPSANYICRTTPFWQMLNEDQRQILLRRVLHRVLRSMGFFLPFRFVEVFRNFIMQPCLEKKNYRQANDAAIAAADIAINTFPSDKYLHAVEKVGTVLEAKGNFEHAAEVYKEFATQFEQPDAACYFHQYAALAFKRCGGDLHHLAEENYLKALFYTHVLPLPNWNVNHEYIQGTFQNLLCLYMDMASPGAACENKPGYTLVGILIALLHFCGFRVEEDATLAYDFRCLVPVGSTALKTQFKSPSQATNALMIATKCTDVQGFRSIILSCCQFGVSFSVEIPELYTRKERKWGEKVVARQFVVLDDRETIHQLKNCSEPSCAVTETTRQEFKRCPCQTVFYCCRACQVRHWGKGGHKRCCPGRS